jgi:hypothetical protein
MDPQLLRDQLAKLHEELGQVGRVDPGSTQLLVEVLRDIQQLLERQRASDASLQPPLRTPHQLSQASAPSARSLTDRLEKIAVQFEVDHPTLAASTRRLVDLLGKVGV